MNLTPLNEALGEMCEARKQWRAAIKAYVEANTARQVADDRWQKAKQALKTHMDAMIEAHK